MKTSKWKFLAVVGWLLLCAVQARADDTDLYNQPPGTNPPAPNILFILDNTANWSRASQKWVGSSTAGDAELLAIKNFVAGLTKPANVGLMMYTTTGHTGGYVRFGVRDMTSTVNNQAFQKLLAGVNVTSPTDKVNQSSGGIANSFYEAWLYFKGTNSWAGMDGSADYAGNGGATGAGEGLTSNFAYASSSANALYNTPVGTNCAKNYIIFIGNNGPAASPAVPLTSDPSTSTLSSYSYTVTPDVQSTWARFLRLRPDLAAGSLAAANGYVTTYTIDAYNAQQNAAYTTVLQNMAKSGGGKYYQAGSDTSLQTSLATILTQIQAVNSVFAAASLPVSVSVRGTFLNQVYLGVFRPDASAAPNWTGNLKQYQLGVDTTSSTPQLFLTDSNGLAAENPNTGFVVPNAVSFWTQTSTFWNPLYYVNSQGVGGSSDSPDGDLVEKGGAAQYIRTTFATSQTSRNVYTCTGTCTNGSALLSTPFNTSNTAITQTVLGAASSTEHDAIINWVRGGNANLDDPSNATSAATNVRGFVHGDVLHSRPAVINYNRNSDDLVVYYGSNDGMLHAVKGGQTLANGDGNELWTFVAPEQFSQLKRLRDHTPTISSTAPKPYFMDGSPTAYASSSTGTAIDKAYLFVPMRRGGRFIYAFDVSNPNNPLLLWKHSSSDPGFAELGQSWAEMRVAKMRFQTGPVLVFGLGYDATANDPTVPGTATMGRGVMIVDAATGTPLWQAGPSPTGATTNLTVPGMTYDIPSSVALYDSNGDGYIDRLYVPDTGGNVWRINVNDAAPANWTVTKLASLGGTGTNARKFFFPPDIVPADPQHSFDSLMLGSGDREHPFDTNVVNRFYMIKDDHGLLAARTTPITEGTAGSTTGVAGTLYDASADLVQSTNSAQAAAANTALATASGWYFTLAAGEKVVGGSTTLAGSVIFGTNQPQAAAANSCVGNLGVARLYSVSYLDASATISRDNGTTALGATDRFGTRPGGGFPPTPVPISVVLNGNTYQGAISGTQVITPPGPALGRRYRTFWQRLIDTN